MTATATVRTTATMTLRPGVELDEVLEIFSGFIADVHAKDHGVLSYHYYLDETGRRIDVIEEYADGQAHLDHYANLDGAKVGRLLELVELSEPHYYGVPTAAERELLAGFGTVQYHRPLVSIASI